ncbi:hypothetical protein OKW29_000261 [Paraburkholderia sp. CI3]
MAHNIHSNKTGEKKRRGAAVSAHAIMYENEAYCTRRAYGANDRALLSIVDI